MNVPEESEWERGRGNVNLDFQQGQKKGVGGGGREKLIRGKLS